MKDKDYSSYAPDKHGPAAEARKAESQAFIEKLRVKHGVSLEQLYPKSDRNPYHSELRK